MTGPRGQRQASCFSPLCAQSHLLPSSAESSRGVQSLSLPQGLEEMKGHSANGSRTQSCVSSSRVNREGRAASPFSGSKLNRDGRQPQQREPASARCPLAPTRALRHVQTQLRQYIHTFSEEKSRCLQRTAGGTHVSPPWPTETLTSVCHLLKIYLDKRGRDS